MSDGWPEYIYEYLITVMVVTTIIEVPRFFVCFHDNDEFVAFFKFNIVRYSPFSLPGKVDVFV